MVKGGVRPRLDILLLLRLERASEQALTKGMMAMTHATIIMSCNLSILIPPLHTRIGILKPPPTLACPDLLLLLLLRTPLPLPILLPRHHHPLLLPTERPRPALEQPHDRGHTAPGPEPGLVPDQLQIVGEVDGAPAQVPLVECGVEGQPSIRSGDGITSGCVLRRGEAGLGRRVGWLRGVRTGSCGRAAGGFVVGAELGEFGTEGGGDLEFLAVRRLGGAAGFGL